MPSQNRRALEILSQTSTSAALACPAPCLTHPRCRAEKTKQKKPLWEAMATREVQPSASMIHNGCRQCRVVVRECLRVPATVDDGCCECWTQVLEASCPPEDFPMPARNKGLLSEVESLQQKVAYSAMLAMNHS